MVLVVEVGDGGREPDTKGPIRTLLLQPLRPSYSQAIMLSSSGSAGPLARARELLLQFLAIHRHNREELVNYRPSLTRNDGPVNGVTPPVNRDVFIGNH